MRTIYQSMEIAVVCSSCHDIVGYVTIGSKLLTRSKAQFTSSLSIDDIVERHERFGLANSFDFPATTSDAALKIPYCQECAFGCVNCIKDDQHSDKDVELDEREEELDEMEEGLAKTAKELDMKVSGIAEQLVLFSEKGLERTIDGTVRKLGQVIETADKSMELLSKTVQSGTQDLMKSIVTAVACELKPMLEKEERANIHKKLSKEMRRSAVLETVVWPVKKFLELAADQMAQRIASSADDIMRGQVKALQNSIESVVLGDAHVSAFIDVAGEPDERTAIKIPDPPGPIVDDDDDDFPL